MTNGTEYTKAQRFLARRDPVLKRLIKQVGNCTLQIDANYFAVLVRAIVSQQISAKAAAAVMRRLENLFGKRGIGPRKMIQLPEEKIRQAGLSASKTKYVRELAEKVNKRALRLTKLPEMSDEEVISHLLPVRGIGHWTIEMLLIFGLGRMDVLPIADWGLRANVQKHYQLETAPEKELLTKMAEVWRPYRTIATWYFWKSAGPVPQS